MLVYYLPNFTEFGEENLSVLFHTSIIQEENQLFIYNHVSLHEIMVWYWAFVIQMGVSQEKILPSECATFTSKSVTYTASTSESIF